MTLFFCIRYLAYSGRINVRDYLLIILRNVVVAYHIVLFRKFSRWVELKNEHVSSPQSTTCFNAEEFSALLRQCICVFRIILKINREFFPNIIN